MVPSYHHAFSSARRFGVADDGAEVHSRFDRSNWIVAEFRHLALRHHAEGSWLETIFGIMIANSTGRPRRGC